MGCHEDGLPFAVQPADGRHQLLGGGIVQIGERFIHDNNFWIHNQNAGYGQPPFFSAGQGGGVPVFQMGQMHACQDLIHFFSNPGPGGAQVLQAECHFICHSVAHDLGVGILEHHANGLPGDGQISCHRTAIQPDIT